MSDIEGKRRRIEQLVAENDALEAVMRSWQERGEVGEGELIATRKKYIEWYSRAKKEIPEDQRARFVDMYEGGSVITRVRGYLQSPLEPNKFHDPTNPFFSGKWQLEFSAKPSESLGVQRDILIEALDNASDIGGAMDELEVTFRRLPEFLNMLRSYANPNVPSPTIGNEKDLQALVHALLVLHYGDVREEDFVPRYAGGSSRVDFLLREVGIVIETKMTRAGLGDRKVGEELIIDWNRYSKHPDCRGIFALVYDPDRIIRNPSGLESDLTGSHDQIVTKVIVVW